jgi:hypothetical protein
MKISFRETPTTAAAAILGLVARFVKMHYIAPMKWRTFLGLAEASPVTWKDLERRVGALEADHEYLVAEHIKLRGRVTGGLRRPKPEAEVNGGSPGGDRIPSHAPPGKPQLLPGVRERSLRSW